MTKKKSYLRTKVAIGVFDSNSEILGLEKRLNETVKKNKTIINRHKLGEITSMECLKQLFNYGN
jgi:hypothetical protein